MCSHCPQSFVPAILRAVVSEGLLGGSSLPQPWHASRAVAQGKLSGAAVPDESTCPGCRLHSTGVGSRLG